MNPRRFATVLLALCPAAFLAGWSIAWLADLGLADVEKTSVMPLANRLAPPVADRPAPPLTIDVVVADTSPATTMGNTTAAPVEPNPVTAEAAPADASQTPPPQPQPVQTATANTPDPAPGEAKATPDSFEIVDECLVGDVCIDRYLWGLYQRTPKEDTIKEHERRKVMVKRRGKTVAITKSVIELVDEDFAWKDSKAAEKADMPMQDYVIGGMDRDFKLKLFHALHAADEAGLSPGITSAFRDDYRQSIASGLKAAANRSYHGGSLRGGYGHGLAADVVSVKGETRDERWASSEILWKWIDAHGKEFGIGRPYLDRDPSHVAPIDGQEYVSHQNHTKIQRAGSDQKRRNRLAVREERAIVRRPKSVKTRS